MRLFILTLILLTASAEAGMPKWWPVTRGQLLEQAEKSAEMDKNLAEYDQIFLKTASDIPELGPYLRVLEYMTKNNLEMTESNLKIAIENTRRSEQSGNFIGSIVKAVATGDPMSMVAALTTGLGLLGAGMGRRGQQKAEAEARRHKLKGLKLAHMTPEEAKKALKDDDDYPDIIA